MIIDLGKISTTPKGVYNSSVIYERLDIVTNDGSSYISLVDHNTLPLNNPSGWQIIAEKGGKGDTGETGYKTIDPDPISPSDVTPTEVGWYAPTEIGIYNNIGGLEALSGYETFFHFDGTTWIKKQTPSTTNIVDGSITTAKTNFAETNIIIGKNLADPALEHIDNYINWDNGTLSPNPAYNAYFKIPIESDTDYFFHSLFHMSWHDSTGAFISGENVGGISTTRHSPINAKFVSASFSSANTTVQIEKGTVGTSYEPYTSKEEVNIENLKVIPNQTSFIEEKLVYYKNRFNKALTISGQFVNAFTGALNPNVNYVASDYCYIQGLDKITLTNLIHIAFYDVNKVYISGREYGGDTIDVPTNAVWCRVSLLDNGMKETFQIEEGENKTPYEPYQTPATKLVIPDLYLPEPVAPTIKRPLFANVSIMYWMAGRQMNIYFDSAIYKPIANNINYYTSVFSYRGKFLQDKYRVTPTEDYNFILKIEDMDGISLQKNTDVVVAVTGSGSGMTRNLLTIGDSTVNAGITLKEVSDFFNTDPMNINFLGTRETLGIKHEGRGGWTFNDYATEGRALFKFNYASATVSKDDIYSTNGSQYTIVEVNAGYFSAQRTSGSTNPTSTGTLTRVSGSGDTSINYTSYEILDSNPFWNFSTSEFDLNMYLTNTSQTLVDNDWVIIQLGINDLFGAALGSEFNVEARISQMKSQLSMMISKIHTYNPNIRIGIVQTIPPAISQDATGNLNNSSFYSLEYYVKKGLVRWWDEIIKTYDNSSSRSSRIYILSATVVIDRVNNFPTIMENIDSHNTTQIIVQNNDVHPDDPGYKQIADVYIGIIKCFG